MAQRQVIYPTWQPLIELPHARGSVPIPTGVLEFWVTANFVTLPEQILVGVRIPEGGDTIHATYKAGSVTHDGFTVVLDGKATKSGHWLDYLAALP